jgi:hypothetical protein
MPSDPQTRAAIAAHEEWRGFVQPVGLVVAPPVLVERGVVIDRNIRPRQEVLDNLLDDNDENAVVDVKPLFTDLLGWEESDLLPPEPEHRVRLTELDVTLEPNWRVVDREGATQLLIQLEDKWTDLDSLPAGAADGWSASPQARFERLLRATGIPAGLLCTPGAVRLVYAPAGETSGHLTFRIADMAQVMGRPILAAFTLLLGEYRLFRAEPRERLTGTTGLLAASREAQNLVSTRLARQVLGALHELLRGFVATDARRQDGASPIRRLASEKPHELYAGLVTVLMRLVFVLYAEERDLMPADRLYEDNYGLRGLFKKLRDDAARHGDDLMDRRYGAWARLLSLFRLIHSGGGREGFAFTARKGRLFEPNRFPFLEGREDAEEPVGSLPMVSDGTLWRVLERLLVLDGERISYRTLDVEEIGSVYQAIMGFRIEQRAGRALALKSRGRHGAGTVVDLDDLLSVKPSERKKRLNELDVAALAPREEKAVVEAASGEALAEALIGKADEDATPAVARPGQPLLQATDERRRSGSHYTPRSLTQPIVAETLRPTLERLGPQATPEQILSLKVLDPAMGSGAFLVEACRQLADALVRAWEAHRVQPAVPPDEDLLLYAKRLIAQRCLYGVDRNELAAELGKLSLWLATLARDHEFSFLDHCIRHGDSLVGLDRQQIEALTWAPKPTEAPADLMQILVRDRLAEVERERERIRAALDDAPEDELRLLLSRFERALADPKQVGDAVIAAFFAGDRAKAREDARLSVRDVIEQGGAGWQNQLQPAVKKLRTGTQAVVPFHWPLEFPEVFDRDNPGFDAIVGNPPFLGGTRIEPALGRAYRDWVVDRLAEGRRGLRGAADLCVYFFLRSFALSRRPGNIGLLATNSIAQGDSRVVGLKPILERGGVIYRAMRSMQWPGDSATHVAAICISSINDHSLRRSLDGKEVSYIDAALSAHSVQKEPEVLRASNGIAFKGVTVAGMGFVVSQGEAANLIQKDSRNARVVLPYLIGDDLNQNLDQQPSRWVINFKDMPLDRSGEHKQNFPVASDYPEALQLVIDRVKPERINLPATTSWNRGLISRWWQFGLWRPALEQALVGKDRAVVTSRVTAHHCFAVVPTNVVFSDRVVVLARDDWAIFATVSSRVHEFWAHRPGATTQGTTLNYLQARAFATFPLPPSNSKQEQLELAGRNYHECRAAVMQQNGEGLTQTYNRFHDPKEVSNEVRELRRLHEAMDLAVLDAYGWSDIRPACDFELEWEDDEADSARRRRKPWRYRWPEPIRDEVLARLLALNAERAEEERLAFGDQ